MDTKKKDAIASSTVSDWEKSEKFLRSQTKEKLRSKHYFLKDKKDYRLRGKFWTQQLKTKEDVKDRRFKELPVSVKWIRRRMTHHCKTDKPKGFDKKTNKFSQNWAKKCMKRNGMSMRRKTNIQM